MINLMIKSAVSFIKVVSAFEERLTDLMSELDLIIDLILVYPK